MTDLLIRDVRLATHGGALGWLRARRGRIDAVARGSTAAGAGEAVLEGDGHWLLPGFVDAHVHGGFGEDVMAGDPEGLRRLARRLVSAGVTAFSPTLMTADRTDSLVALRSVAAAMGEIDGGATVLAAHLEGPYLSRRRCGAQPPASIRPFDPAELDTLVATGAVGRMTVAPEAPGNEGLVAALVRAGVAVSVGHSDADADATMQAVEQGARGVTHLFNAMPPLHHRAPGLAGIALTDDRLVVEVIADGVHVDLRLLDLVRRTKGPDGMALITDALPVAGTTAPGDLEMRDGAVWLDADTLAGSCLTLDRALRNLAAATGEGPAELWPTVTRAPARLVGVADTRGDLAEGLVADAVLLDDRLEVVATVVGGRIVHTR